MRRNDLTEIAGSTGFPRISIYFPTHRTFPEAEQDPIRLSNAVKEAEKQLAEAGVRQIDKLLAKARKRTDEHNFWRYQDHGLAVLIEDGETRWLKVPKEVPELTVVAERYHVRPLIDIFSDSGRYHVLAATRDSVRFFDGAERDFEEKDVDELPSSLAEIKGRTDFEDQAGYHASSRGSTDAPQYHALGESAEDYEEVELGQFAHSIAKAVDQHLKGDAAPLILVAQPRLLGRLKQVLDYGNVAEKDLQRDPTSMTDDALHAATWKIAGPLLREPRDALRERCAAWLGGADIPGSKDVPKLMRSAEEGRIETLLLQPGANVWGRYDESKRELTRSEENAADNEDLLNLLALKTLQQGGDVISLSNELSEKAGPVVGLYRY
jgi:protein required for attachment to host cells